MDEFSLIKAIKQHTYRQESLHRGIGDDGAVFKETTNELVVAVDTFVEEIHFTKQTMNAKQIGYRALAANFSDLAAMGAIPMFYLVSITVSPHWNNSKIKEVFQGMKDLADSFHADLIGGDTVSGHNLALSITVIGKVENGQARYRSDAKVGDVVFVTGTLGDSQAGLYLLKESFKIKNREYFVKRHQLPTPRINFANGLKNIKRVALNDISDGVGSELHEIAEASDISVQITDELIPIHPELKHFPRDLQERWKYFGGEDFELVGTVSEEEWRFVQQAANKLKLPVTAIGNVIMKGESPVYLRRNGRTSPLEKLGYTHLR